MSSAPSRLQSSGWATNATQAGSKPERRFVSPPEQPAASQPEGRLSPVQFLRRHWLIIVILLLAAIARLIVMLAYPPGFWFPDSFPYVSAAINLAPYQIRPLGYSFLLILLEPLHSVFVVVALQHAMGLVMGVEVYVLLRRQKIPLWGCALAAVPLLLSAPELQIEHFVLSDTLFAFLSTTALFLLLWRSRPPLWACAAIGLMLAWAIVDRSQGMLLIVPFLIYLAIIRLGLRRFVASTVTMCVACLVPVAAYAWWFHQSFGEYQLTTSTGPFLYSRVAPFADCSIIKPPSDERWLCLTTPPSKRQSPDWYVWASASPLQHGPGYAFANGPNSLETNFALRAIMAQPADYLKAVWSATVETFMPLRDTNYSADQYLFPTTRPESAEALAKATYGNYPAAVAYNGGANPSTRVNQPYAQVASDYQRFVVLPGPLLAVIVVCGLLGMALARRRCRAGIILTWLTGAILIVTPAATADFDARYVVSAVPAFCIACALGAREISSAWSVWGPRVAAVGRRFGAGSARERSGVVA